ncbi:MAG: bifunctional folylpolyglutamate synthase/dihydrofolate synthase [Clostridiales bacterium]|nr:bifunctional folylpolyglutamate synthase/dihydrofolate synthase [Clostridiales bacterium]
MTDAIRKIHSFERFGCKLGLERMERLVSGLGNPQKGMNFIHVAGTNGKGSVCRYIYEAIRESGHKTGLFTSPYILEFNERIEFDGCCITDSELEACAAKALAQAEEITNQGFESPTEFELITAVAFLYFKEKKADCVVLEVGLGGRGDSTNIIKNPLVSVITSISFDHMDRLGGTLAEIACEKAGIIKKGATVVSNVQEAEAAEVIAKRAGELGCDLVNVAEFKYDGTKKTRESYSFDAKICETVYNGVEVAMLGEHQIQNAMTALAALEVLREKGKIEVTRDGIYSGLLNARQPGRFEILRKDPYFVIDGAHNENGAEALKNTMKDLFPGSRALMVVGMLADKDVSGILGHFCEIADDFIAAEPDNPRRLSAEKLCAEIRSAGKSCVPVADPVSACGKAFEMRGNYDVILIAGSLYLLGKVRSIIDG